MDCLRFLSLNRNLATCFKQAYYLGDIPNEEVFLFGRNKDRQIAYECDANLVSMRRGAIEVGGKK